MRLILVFIICLFTQRSSAQEVAFIIPDKHLVPECITWSPRQKCFYLTSIHKSKIIKYDPFTKQTTDFINHGQNGFDAGIGLIVDNKRNILWSATGRQYENEFYTGIYAWDLQSSSLIHKYSIKDTIPRLYNDLALDENGNVYVTDTYDSKIYFFNTSMGMPVAVAELEYPNGICIDPQNSLYVASHTKGIVKIDIHTKSQTNLDPGNLSSPSTGIDGLKFYKNSLIGVRNATQDRANNKLVRYHLNKKKNNISSVMILDEKNPHFLLPTTGVIVKRNYYLIANSNLPLLDQDTNTFPDESKLKETVILRYKL